MAAPRLSLDAYERGVTAGDRAVLGRAITLVESTRPSDRELARDLLARLAPRAGNAVRVGITGIPGAGKSTLIDALGTHLTAELGERVAVLAVDPSSERSGGSILGDKTRMARLAVDPRAFIRPSPAAGTLGGVAQRTRETMLLCEAAGFSVVLVETVGVGQSETLVAKMTDFFLVLMIAGAGDQLQGIKRGLMELADLVAINKADGDGVSRARRAATEYRAALRLLFPPAHAWQPQVVTVSALEGTGVADLWAEVLRHREQALASGALVARRATQARRWMWDLVDDGLREAFRADPGVAAAVGELEAAVGAGQLLPTSAAETLLARFLATTQGGDA
ncbi:MAG: methylmalonyl Co-A mutase-associated GTPase MeaB [Myxococcales bacterium]|nr:methylmalonyl Co-A mutase-associated GTPase MeaB [Myxococcales bacterium]MCB9735763.1 methylmalonyl Co-A mutase-associated GTPase MeaB [Deltaproteobacteria bacterium]